MRLSGGRGGDGDGDGDGDGGMLLGKGVCVCVYVYEKMTVGGKEGMEGMDWDGRVYLEMR